MVDMNRKHRLKPILVGNSSASERTPSEPSAVIQIDDTNGGFLTSRITMEQRDRIESPTDGLLIWNLSTGRLEIFSEGEWGGFGSGGSTGIDAVLEAGDWIEENRRIRFDDYSFRFSSSSNEETEFEIEMEQDGLPNYTSYHQTNVNANMRSVNDDRESFWSINGPTATFGSRDGSTQALLETYTGEVHLISDDQAYFFGYSGIPRIPASRQTYDVMNLVVDVNTGQILTEPAGLRPEIIPGLDEIHQANDGVLLLIDTRQFTQTIVPPAFAFAGARFAVSDSYGRASDNNIYVLFTAHGGNFHGMSSDHVISTDRECVEFQYINQEIGWIIR